MMRASLFLLIEQQTEARNVTKRFLFKEKIGNQALLLIKLVTNDVQSTSAVEIEDKSLITSCLG